MFFPKSAALSTVCGDFMKESSCKAFTILFLALMCLAIGVAPALGSNSVICEIEGNTNSFNHSSDTIIGANSGSKQAYKFQRGRYANDFYYRLGDLPAGSYSLELSFCEHTYTQTGQRVFSVYLNESLKSDLNNVDLVARAGKHVAYQKTYSGISPDSNGVIELRFQASKGQAIVNTIKLYNGSGTVAEVDTTRDRHNMVLSTRSSPTTTYETLLSKLGSRFFLNPEPQRLAFRQSPLGTFSGDLSEFILAARNGSGNTRALPFTDKYRGWENIQQNITMTSIEYVCTSSSLPGIKVTYTFKAPFYPQDLKLSTAPFFYLDIKVENTNSSGPNKIGDILIGNPQREIDSNPEEIDEPNYYGYKYTSAYHFGPEQYRASGAHSADQSMVLASNDHIGVTLEGVGSTWNLPSSSYSAPAAAREVYTFNPSSFTGFTWSYDVAASDSSTKTFVISSYMDASNVLWVKDAVKYPSGKNFGFKYKDYFDGIDAVTQYAVDEKDTIEEKREIFDGVLADTELNTEAKNLISFGFQSYLANTWLMSDGFVAPGTGDPTQPVDFDHDWFSVWEGTSCQFHSTIDVEYNLAWFYYQFWPDLLKMELEQWLGYKKSNAQGTYLSHDTGQTTSVAGQAYGHDMPVEENANYILMLYQYWTHTGDDTWVIDDGYIYSNVRNFANFIKNCDTNGNGLPDLNSANTIDQGSDAVQFAKDQIYLGVKALAAYKAAAEMASAKGDTYYANLWNAEITKINATLEDYAWMDDHFSVCLDYSIGETERTAYSIYPSNGLLPLLSSLDSGSTGLSETNLEKIKTDLEKSTEVNVRKYGWVHTSSGNENEWVSQNLWRDMIASYLGYDEISGKNVLDYSKDYYWPLEKYFSQNMSGAFWDVCIYGQDTDWLFSQQNSGGNPDLSEVVSGDSTEKKSIYAKTYSSYGQSLGYYPRGATAFGLIDASGGIRVDKRSGTTKLHLQPVETPTVGNPVTIPVLAFADWENKVIPKAVISVDGNGKPSLDWVNGAPPDPGDETPIIDPADDTTFAIYSRFSGISFDPQVFSPNDDGKNDRVTLSYLLPREADVTARVFSGSQVVRTLNPGGVLAMDNYASSWDGKSDSGSLVDDGDYDVKLEADPTEANVVIPPVTRLARVNRTIPELSKTWYLAEGFTGSNPQSGDFDQWVLIQNPGAVGANTTVQFMQRNGEVVTRNYYISPYSRFTIHVDEILPDSEVSTYVSSDQDIGVERAMYFNGWKAGHDSIGVTAPSKTWYLAEGFTGKNAASGEFDEWVLIQNPGAQGANISVQFMQRNGGVVTRSYYIAPRSRFTIHVDEILPDSEVSTYISSDQGIIVERSQYLNDMKSGHNSLGAVSKSRTWYLAEGYTGGSFDEWVLIQNPNSSTATVRATFTRDNGQVDIRTITIPARSRYTIHVDELMDDAQVSTFIKSDIPVIAERAMYFGDYEDGHCSVGTPTADTEWHFPEGYTGSNSACGQFDTWILIQTPGSLTTNVTVQFMKRDRQVITRTYEIQGRRRFTIHVNSIVPDSEVSTFVSADQPIIAERAMYFNNWRGGTCSIGAR